MNNKNHVERAKNNSPMAAERPESILRIVRRDGPEMSHVNVSTVFNLLGRMAEHLPAKKIETWPQTKTSKRSRDEDFQALSRRALDFARDGLFATGSRRHSSERDRRNSGG